VQSSPTIWTGRVKDTPARLANDIPFDGGALSDTAIPYIHYTVWVSDSAYNNYNKGVTKLRYNLGAPYITGTLQVSQNDIDWADDDYLTIKQEIRPWAVLPNIENTEEDVDHAYVDENEQQHPLARIGPPACTFLSGGSTTVNFWSDDVAIADGAVLASYSWTFTDGTPITADNAGTADVPIEVAFDSCGQKWVIHTAVDDNGKAHTRHSLVYVFDMDSCPPFTAFSIDSLSGDLGQGSWRGTVKVWQDADVSEFPDGAQVIVFNEAYWEGTQVDVGYGWEHRENISFVGYIVKDSVTKDPETGYVVFDVCGICDIMKDLTCWPANLADESPATWHHIPDMTLNLATFHVVTEHTTVDHIADLYLNLDDINIDYIDIAEGDPYNQIAVEIGQAGRAILASNKFGQIYLEPNVQLMTSGDRGGIDVMFELAHDDWMDQIDLGPETDVKECCQVDFIGFTEALVPFGSLAPGRQWTTGSVQKVDGVRVSDQDEANVYSGLFEGWYNAEFKDVSMKMAGFWPIFDIAPQRYLQITLAEGDTNRGLVWSQVDHIIKQVSYDINAEGGYSVVDLTVEQDSIGNPGNTNEIPDDEPIPPTPPPGPPSPPPPPLPDPEGPEKVIVWSRNQLAHTSNFDDVDPVWVDIKPAAVTYISRVVIDGDGKAAWLISGSSSASTTEGIFYTPDIMADSVDWTLKLSQAAAAAAALALPHGPKNDYGIMASAASHGEGSLCVGERKWHGFGDRTGSFSFVTTNKGGAWTPTYLTFIVGVTCDFWMNQYFWYATQQMLFDGSTIWMVGFSGHWNPNVSQVASYLTSTDGISWTLTRAASVSENGLRSVGQVGGGIRGVTESENAYILPGFTLVDTGVGNDTALGLYHPSSLFANATDGAGTGLWKDGAVIETQGNIFPNADGQVLRGVTPWPVAGSKLVLINGYATSNPEIVVWYKNGVMYDKTGNLITIVGTWLGYSSGTDNVGAVCILY